MNHSVSIWVLGAVRRLLAPWRGTQGCLHGVNDRGIVESVTNSTDRMVLVPMTQLDDLLELARLLADRLPDTDPMRLHLIGASSAVRLSATAEP